MKQVIFATTNKNKVTRINNLLDKSQYEILSLADLQYEISEPEEIGPTPQDIAKNKAQYYWKQLYDKLPVITQDDTIQFHNVPELSSPKLSIKSPVIEKYGKFNDEVAITYYTDLAKRFGGRINMELRYGHALCTSDLLESKLSKIECTLVDEISNVLLPDYFLSSIIKVNVNDKETFFSELTDKEQKIVDTPILNSVAALLNTI
ncbi:MAG: non-canonical purine NTP pyrophosphatase [Candidatus Dojkabacteria bacterium]